MLRKRSSIKRLGPISTPLITPTSTVAYPHFKYWEGISAGSLLQVSKRRRKFLDREVLERRIQLERGNVGVSR